MNISDKIFKMKYAREGEDWNKACLRVASYVAEAEREYGLSEEEISRIRGDFYDLIYNKYFIPGGRILANANTEIKNLMNCFSLGIEDSREGIYQTLKDAAEIFAHGGGVGINYSDIREKGAPVKTTGGLASGPLSFMSLFDQTGEVISQASRRGAQLGLLDCDHPDIEEYISYKSEINSRNKRIMEEYKRNLTSFGLNKDNEKYFKVLEKTLTDDQLSHFNISVVLNDAFMEAVIEDRDWNLISRIDGSVKKTVKARDILRRIAREAWKSGDPGVVFVDTINENNIVPYLGTIKTQNPCLYKDTILLDNDTLRKISENAVTYNSWKVGIRECIKLKTNAGHEIILTPEHKIMLESGKFEEARNTLGKSLKWGLGYRFSNKIDEKYVLAGALFARGSKEDGLVKISINKKSSLYNLFLKHGFKSSGLHLISYDTSIFPHGDSVPVLYEDSCKARSFLMGLFDLGGHVTNSGTIRLKTASNKIAKELQILLASFGVKSTTFDDTNYIEVENVLVFMQRIGFYSSHKKFRRYIIKKEKKLKVVSIENVGEQEVWDFNIFDNYNFGNGLIVHNCGEIPLFPNESCCLGSINLLKFYDEKTNSIDFEHLEKVIRTAIRFLDDVQTVSFAPLDKVNQMSKGLRRVGLGVMGWADLLAELEMPYDSDETIDLGQFMSWFISFFSILESIELARSRGAFPLYDKDKVNLDMVEKILNSKYNPNKFNMENIRQIGLRNVSVTSLPPTGTISLLAGVNSSIEPFFALAYKRNITTGIGNSEIDSIIEINNILMKKLKKIGFDDKKIEDVKNYILKYGTISNYLEIPENIRRAFKTAHEIDWKKHIEMVGAWQAYITNSISKTINLPSSATEKDIYDSILLMWVYGLKSGTVYRDKSKSFQILNVGNIN